MDTTYLVEAEDPFKLHPTSMSYTDKVLRHLQMFWFWMGIWMHTHTVSTKEVSPVLGKLAEVLGDGSVQNISLCFC